MPQLRHAESLLYKGLDNLTVPDQVSSVFRGAFDRLYFNERFLQRLLSEVVSEQKDRLFGGVESSLQYDFSPNGLSLLSGTGPERNVVCKGP